MFSMLSMLANQVVKLDIVYLAIIYLFFLSTMNHLARYCRIVYKLILNDVPALMNPKMSICVEISGIIHQQKITHHKYTHINIYSIHFFIGE